MDYSKSDTINEKERVIRFNNGTIVIKEEHVEQNVERKNLKRIDRKKEGPVYFEGCGKEGPIKAICFCEFHPTLGPLITCQVPHEFISKDTFEAVSVYLIPKPQLLRSILTITVKGIKIVGFPTRIDNKKYARNAFYFNVCFVCDAWARTVQYDSVVKKLTEFLTVLEIENNFLSKRGAETSKNDKLYKMLKKVYKTYDIFSYKNNGVCTLSDDNTSTHLKVLKIRPDPLAVHDHDVPVLLESMEDFFIDQWDLTTQQIFPHINGINHLFKIAALADVEVNLVKTCLQNLVYYNVVKLIPIFQYSNSYVVTPKIRLLTQNKKLQDICVRKVAKSGWPVESSLPTFRDVLKLYCSMSHGMTVKDLCIIHNPSSLRVDERKFVQFSLVEGYIRRLNKYPVLLSGNVTDNSRYSYYTGNYSYDKICCDLGITTSSLDEEIEKDPNVGVIYK